MSQYIKLLSDISFMAGVIGFFEYYERYEIADWLEDSTDQLPDPRGAINDGEVFSQIKEFSDESNADAPGNRVAGADNEPPEWLELLMLNQWMFTIGDRDCYPSVPHGHFKAKTNEWPKLNPYTGRVFVAGHKEDSAKRLNKKEMIDLWNNTKFVERCREQVLWYSDFAPAYQFPRARRGKLIFPKW